jgi:uncharacterized protein (TIGR00297 family)
MISTRRESTSLRWQSRLLVSMVTPFCVLAAGTYAAKSWTLSTRTALLISVGFTAIVWLARAATRLAALTGGVLTAVLGLFPAGGGAKHWFYSGVPALAVLFLLTFAATRFGRSMKENLGVAEKRSGRSAAQVVANLGMAGVSAAFALAISMAHEQTLLSASLREGGRLLSPSMLYSVMVAAALGEATADTLSSEFGAVLGGEPVLVTTWQRVAPGTDGAISVAGTIAGVLGGLVVVVVAALTLRLSLHAAVAAGVGGLAGFFFDSLLGATAERHGRLNNDAVNFLSTAAAVAVALVVFLA